MSTHGTILLVDDDAAVIDFMAAVLTDEGYHVQWATTGADAVAAILAIPPDLILMDLVLGRMSGLDVLRTVRTQGSTVPIVVMTAATRTDQELAQPGVTALLRKPFDLTDLLACVAAHLPGAVGVPLLLSSVTA